MGTAVKCTCCGSETLCYTHPEQSVLAIKDRRHGTAHMLVMSLDTLVQALDPNGTRYRRVVLNGHSTG